MPWSSNATFLVALELDGVEGRGIYKPERGEQILSDFPESIYRREVAAFELSNSLGLNLVPETVVRPDAPYGVGSIQRFIEADFSEHYFTLIEDPQFEPELRRIAGLDLLLNNADRKGGHILRSIDDGLFAIDNGLSFHVAPKLRTVMWDYAGDRLPVEIENVLSRLVEEIPAKVSALIERDEIAALVVRARRLIDTPYFPLPDPNRRSHPWPLV
jgi:uncharacterized repeat protein (TIGR03843 family)